MKFFKEISYEQGVGPEIRELLRTTKIVLLKGYSGNDLHEFYEKLSEEVGQWTPMDENVQTDQKTGARWIEIKYDPEFPNSYRHSSTRQPLHTDGSYEKHAAEISFFYCVRPARAGGATTFIDSDELLKTLKSYSEALFQSCCEIPVTFGKGNDSKTKPIITNDSRGVVLTWNYFRVLETSDETTELRREFHKFLEEKVVAGGLCFPCHLGRGDAVFFNDERLLHGRNSFVANSVGERHLLKGGLHLTKDCF
jgi:alpha-ketoglutarate-dependent taurine dioxygenase